MSRQQTVRHTPVKLKTLIFNSLKTCVNVFVWTLGIRGWGGVACDLENYSWSWTENEALSLDKNIVH